MNLKYSTFFLGLILALSANASVAKYKHHHILFNHVQLVADQAVMDDDTQATQPSDDSQQAFDQSQSDDQASTDNQASTDPSSNDQNNTMGSDDTQDY